MTPEARERRLEGLSRPERKPMERSFTLIELLVVIAIISILAAMLMPALEMARDKALTARCQSKLKNTGLAFQFYANDYDGYIPYDGKLTVLEKYTGLPFQVHATRNPEPGKMMYCPAYSDRIDELGHYPKGRTFGHSDLSTWADWRVQSYQQNAWLMPIPASHGWNKSGTDKDLATMNSLRSGSRLILVAESFRKHGYESWDEMYYNPRHSGLCPAIHADGHVEMHPWRPASEYGRAGFLWQPNHGVKHPLTVLSWGNYLHPDFTKWNLIE